MAKETNRGQDRITMVRRMDGNLRSLRVSQADLCMRRDRAPNN
jgi:hypothetical protein